MADPVRKVQLCIADLLARLRDIQVRLGTAYAILTLHDLIVQVARSGSEARSVELIHAATSRAFADSAAHTDAFAVYEALVALHDLDRRLLPF